MISATNDAQWIKRAVQITEAAIDQLVLEFLEVPYLHRVEHSIHARLYGILKTQPHFDRLFPLSGGEETQVIHKEWPETEPRTDTSGKIHRRGNFDLAILSPRRLEEASPANFEVGKIEPPIVIEMGLHYDEQHLSDDADKLENSKVPHAYLVHLVRRRQYEPTLDNKIVTLEKNNPNIKVAFAALQGAEKFVKLLSDTNIQPVK